MMAGQSFQVPDSQQLSQHGSQRDPLEDSVSYQPLSSEFPQRLFFLGAQEKKGSLCDSRTLCKSFEEVGISSYPDRQPMQHIQLPSSKQSGHPCHGQTV